MSPSAKNSVAGYEFVNLLCLTPNLRSDLRMILTPLSYPAVRSSERNIL